MSKLIGMMSDVRGTFLMVYVEQKSSKFVYLFSNTDENDRVLFNAQTIYSFGSDLKPYLVGAVKQLRISNKYYVFGDTVGIYDFLKKYNDARVYTYTQDETIDSGTSVDVGVLSVSGSYKTDKWSYSFKKVGDYLSSLSLGYDDLIVNLSEEVRTLSLPRSIEFIEVDNKVAEQALGAVLINSMSMDDLRIRLNLSWYELFNTDGDREILKRYDTISTVSEFELKCVIPLCETVIKNKEQGKKTIVSLDTETDGLFIYNVDKNNPVKSHMVSVQLSWDDDSGAVIFIDMEYFPNVKLSDISDFLRKITVRNPDFTGTEVQVDCRGRTFKFHRDDILMTGHNAMFDCRVLLDAFASQDGFVPFFDYDTLQLLFNLYPTVAKGLRKLKSVTPRVFGHETPELDDVLGSGNEDKYRLISDLEVAALYGCADTDYTRMLCIKLLELTPEKLLKAYNNQDSWYMQRLVVAEYDGVRMKEQELKDMALNAKQDLKILENFVFEYVGRYVSISNYISAIERQRAFDLITEEQYNDMLQNPQIEYTPYEFKMSGNDIRNVLYKVLKYPIVSWTSAKGAKSQDTGTSIDFDQMSKQMQGDRPPKKQENTTWTSFDGKLPSVDKYAMKKLLEQKTDESTEELKEDVLHSGSDEPMIEKDKFNHYKYPIAYVLSLYKTLDKEFTSYFNPILEENLEGRMFKSFSTAAIETRRTSNAMQTMKGALKNLVVPFSDDYYLVDFDMSQIEYRFAASIAKFSTVIEKMKDPEKDYHTETASLVHGIKAHKVTKKVRKAVKGVSFGRIYGLGNYRMCENMFGNHKNENMIETRKVCYIFDNAQRPIMDLFDVYKKKALVPVEVKPLFYKIANKEEGTQFGVSENVYGFRRYFVLDPMMSSGDIASIGRKAANYPIQSGAAELFRYVLKRFYFACLEAGVTDKVLWHMVVHDELLLSVHKSVHPALICKLVYEATTISPKGHTVYYSGVNIGHTWEDCKDDKSEMPVIAVQRIIDGLDKGEFKDLPSDPIQWFKDYKHDYILNRIEECLLELQPNFRETGLNIDTLLDTFENYCVRGYVTEYFKPNDKSISKSAYETDEYWVSCLESWCLEKYGPGKIGLKFKDVVYTVQERKMVSAVVEDKDDNTEEDLDIEDLFAEDQNQWSFDDTVGVRFYEQVSEEEFDGYSIDEERVGNISNPAELYVIDKPAYKNLTKSKKHITIRTANLRDINRIKEFLNPYLDKTEQGLKVCFSYGAFFQDWQSINKNALDDLDEFITGLKETKGAVKCH